ncbi:PIG-L family deacetylase [Streptomyces hoynatensis]|uniref:Carbohydrate-binding domain-containing protein n=1 Tax=Streptomyces hoynatensis TaxID=1141874 RepID=A0A3A9Z7Z1_9ACTN|nr:PIG-L family deacetylase [Streptomyces hoynatensis]RKN43954.1 hypothetical protein D7294_09720 [Streptomyces hoynatensis]
MDKHTPTRPGPPRARGRRRAALAAAALAGLLCTGPAAPQGLAEGPPDLDVLFVGAHPDDEYQSLATFGQWGDQGLATGVVTITRGEGGGSATGAEEGARLGAVREAEERLAVAHAGIDAVFPLGRPDFWYTLSAPLTAAVWDERATLFRLVRLIRATTPDTLVTMDPRPFAQHGGHQEAARLAIAAFRLAADPAAFGGRLAAEGHRPWRVSRLLTQHWTFEGPRGPGCAAHHGKDPHTGLPVTGFWTGAPAPRHGTTWAQAEREAAREYATQGFASLPPTVTTDPGHLPCEWFTVLAEGGEPIRAPVREQPHLLPAYAEFRDWAVRAGLPWLANEAQPAYPAGPSAPVPESTAPPLTDGAESPGEYPGPALPLAHWEGERCATAADCAATARLAWHGDALHALVRVADEARGAALDAATDCKRHWRTDAVELALDPRGTARDTSTTFKLGVLPFTARGAPCAARDADQWQGPAALTAPGTRVAARFGPHAGPSGLPGYAVEIRVPFANLPAAADPAHFRLNILVYDSDTADRTGQTRLAWSPFGSAQADPLAWGHAPLTGYLPPPGRPETPAPPRIPAAATGSRDSPASAGQGRRTAAPPAGGPRLPR